jgi:copper resistance protein B
MKTLATLSLAGLLAAASVAAPAQTQPIATAMPAMTMADMPPVNDNSIFAHVMFNQLEGRFGGSRGGDFRWDGQGWIGMDYDKLWIKSEGFVRASGTVDDGRHEFLYDRAISTYWDLQAGLRADLDSRPSREWAAFGVQGLAPLFFDLEATAYVSDQGHFAGRVQASYDLLITNRLILQPEAELNVYSKADPARLVGAGFSDLDTGLRLRYEFDRKFSPYIGVALESKFGQTADFARKAGESTSGVRFLLGVRTWF